MTSGAFRRQDPSISIDSIDRRIPLPGVTLVVRLLYQEGRLKKLHSKNDEKAISNIIGGKSHGAGPRAVQCHIKVLLHM